jgi:cellulose synthase/poly-beta-1,6-N-acetylglucosamine synthase-like glycosyltransferase
VTVIIAFLLSPLVVLTCWFAIELFAGIRPLRQSAPNVRAGCKVVVIVPAHDEEAVVARTLAQLQQASKGRAQILVVADNCTDSTAQIARRFGIRVVERLDPARRGKGFALDFAREQLRSAPPDVLVIIDADCLVDSSSIERLVEQCAATERPCQAIYLQARAPNGSPTLQLSTFAFFVKNAIRQRALQRLAGRVHLAGTGMALPWKLFANVDLANANIVEDMEMGLELADAGYPAMLVEDAVVWSDPATQAATMDQRSRWEGGYLDTAAKWGPRGLMKSITSRDVRGLWAAVSLFVPPLTMLLFLDCAAFVIAAVVTWLTGAQAWPLLLLAGAVLLVAVGLILVWFAGGSRFVSLRSAACVPLYLLWKVPLYIGLLRRGSPKEWVRTRRG